MDCTRRCGMNVWVYKRLTDQHLSRGVTFNLTGGTVGH